MEPVDGEIVEEVLDFGGPAVVEVAIDGAVAVEVEVDSSDEVDDVDGLVDGAEGAVELDVELDASSAEELVGAPSSPDGVVLVGEVHLMDGEGIRIVDVAFGYAFVLGVDGIVFLVA